MEPYNVKILKFPDGTEQYRIYHRAVDNPKKMVMDDGVNPFDGKRVYNVRGDLDEHFKHSSEVSLKRTKQKVYFYARSNLWDWFVTFTFSPDKVDRFDYDCVCDKLKNWLIYIRRLSPGVSYLVVPERHKSGAWHFHGLFAGLDDRLIEWTGKYVIRRIGKRKFVRSPDKIYKFCKYKLGWMTATRVKDMDRVTSYITKYLTKDMMEGLYGRKRYWASRNLFLPAEEVLLMDEFDKIVLATDLGAVANYHRSAVYSYGEFDQAVDLYEL